MVLLNLIRKRRHNRKIVKLSPIFALFNYNTFGQTQTGATVPVKFHGRYANINKEVADFICMTGSLAKPYHFTGSLFSQMSP